MVNFILTGLNSDVGLTTSPQYPTATTPPLSDISSAFIATIKLSKNGIGDDDAWKAFSLNNLFYFKTTDPDLSSNSLSNDMSFRCVPVNWPTILFSEGVVTSGKESVDIYSDTLKMPFISTNHTTGLHSDTTNGNNYRINSIGPARLAFQITGGYNNSDIFANEDELRQQYFNLDTSGSTPTRSDDDVSNRGIKQNIQTKLFRAGTDTANGVGDVSPLSNADTGVENITREILLQLLNSNNPADIQRVHNMISDASGATQDSEGNAITAGDTSNLWIPILFAVGDTVTFRIRYKVANIQDVNSEAAKDSAGNILGSGKITDQEFQIKIIIVT